MVWITVVVTLLGLYLWACVARVIRDLAAEHAAAIADQCAVELEDQVEDAA